MIQVPESEYKAMMSVIDSVKDYIGDESLDELAIIIVEVRSGLEIGPIYKAYHKYKEIHEKEMKITRGEK
jgi:hypothetical protein